MDGQNTRVHRAALIVVMIATALVPATVASRAAAEQVAVAAPAVRPNVVVLLVDDARADDFDSAYMPHTNGLIGDRGARFDRFYSPFPLCCPARATLLTGQYAHNHGVLGNAFPSGFFAFDDDHTLGTWLDDSYQTGFVGKYLNGYGSQGTPSRYVPPGWDEWNVPTQPTLYQYRSFEVNHNGVLGTVNRYATTWAGDQAVDFINDATTDDEPFFLHTSFIAPHNGFPRHDGANIPSPYVQPKYRDSYRGPRVPEDRSFNEGDVSDKNPQVAGRPLLGPAEIAVIAEALSQRREALRSVDDQVARVVRALEATGELDDTHVLVMSDNGQMLGEHRIKAGKKVLYEPSARVPLQWRGPDVPAGVHIDKLTGLMDVAPTLLQLAGVPVRPDALGLALDGRSLVGTLDNVAGPRPVVLENHSTPTEFNPGRWIQRGLETDRWVYVNFPLQGGFEELYDLRTDPFETENLAQEPAFAGQLQRMRSAWQRLSDCAGTACR